MSTFDRAHATPKRRANPRRLAALAALLLGAVLVVVGFGQTTASAVATMTVHVKVASLDQSTSCGDDTTATGAHFVINQINKADAPLTITVFFSDGSSGTGVRVNNNAHESGYDAVLPAGTHVTDATAVVPTTWSGQFVLSHYICGGTPSTSSSAGGSSSVAGSSSSVAGSSSAAVSSTVTVTTTGAAAVSATSAAAPIPGAVAAGRHTTDSTPLTVGAALMALGALGLFATVLPRRRGARS
jgi:hypothetical protein